MQVYLYYIGKPRDAALNAYTEEFLKRTRRWTAVECREIDPARFVMAEKRKGARRIYLDPAGKAMATAEFTALLRGLEDEGRDAVFLVGAHEGLTAEQRAEADLLLSVSAFTLSHELARAVLAEQIYRAFAALRGHPYGR